MSFDDDIDILRRLMESFFGNNNFTGGIKFIDSDNRRIPNYSNRDDIDIHTDNEHIYITAELRVPDEDMKVTPQKNGIIIEAMIDGSWRRWPIQIPSACNPKSAKITYVNGVLDVTLDIVESNNNGI